MKSKKPGEDLVLLIAARMKEVVPVASARRLTWVGSFNRVPLGE